MRSRIVIRCITFDFRGHGQSEITQDGYDMDTLYRDAAALIEALGCAPCHFVGLSLGGFIGMRLAARRLELLRSLILLGTSVDPEPAENVPRAAQFVLEGLQHQPEIWSNLKGQVYLGDEAFVTEANV